MPIGRSARDDEQSLFVQAARTVELPTGGLVRCASAEDADLLRAFLAEEPVREPQTEERPSVAVASVAGPAVDEGTDQPAVAPVKRGPGRPRKQQS